MIEAFFKTISRSVSNIVHRVRSQTWQERLKPKKIIQHVDVSLLSMSASAGAIGFALAVRPQEHSPKMKGKVQRQKNDDTKARTSPSHDIAFRSVQRYVAAQQGKRQVLLIALSHRRVSKQQQPQKQPPETQVRRVLPAKPSPSPSPIASCTNSRNRVRFSGDLIQHQSAFTSHRPYGSILRRSNRVSPVNREWVANGDRNAETLGAMEKHFSGKSQRRSAEDMRQTEFWFRMTSSKRRTRTDVESLDMVDLVTFRHNMRVALLKDC